MGIERKINGGSSGIRHSSDTREILKESLYGNIRQLVSEPVIELERINELLQYESPGRIGRELPPPQRPETYIEGVLNTVHEPLLVLDKDLRILSASPSFRGRFASSGEEMLGKVIYTVGKCCWDTLRMRDLFENILRTNNEISEYPVEQDLPDIGKRLLLLNARKIKEGRSGKERIIVALKDITELKRTEMENRRNLMRYDLREGHVYLTKEPAPNLATEAFRDLIKSGYGGLVLSRRTITRGKPFSSDKVSYRWLSEREGEYMIPPDVRRMRMVIDKLPRASAILIDRLDYIILRKGFTRILEFVQWLNDIAKEQGHIIILSLDPVISDPGEFRLLEKESMTVEMRGRPLLKDEFRDVLRYIYNENLLGTRPSYTEVGLGLGLSKPTTRKKLRELVFSGYLNQDLRGRTKLLEVTEKGRRFFQP